MRVSLDRVDALTFDAPAARKPLYVPYYVAALVAMALDFALAVASFVAADHLFHVLLTPGRSQPTAAALVGAEAGVVTVLALAALRGYSGASLRRRLIAAANFAKAWVAAFFVIGWIAFLTQSTGQASRGTVGFAFVIGLLGALPARILLLDVFARRVVRAKLATSRGILIHDGDRAALDGVKAALARNGVDVRAALSFSSEASGDGEEMLRAMIETCREVIAHEKIDAIYLFMPWSDVPRYRTFRSVLNRLPISVYLFPDHHAAEILRSPRVETTMGVGYEVQRAPLDIFARLQKRMLDLSVSATLLLLLAPLLALVALLVRLDSPGPVLFRQMRKGFSGRKFQILKFRSMRVLEDGAEVRQATRDDDRVTRVGRFLRRSSIDELPQLINVLKGEMSLVGPRPHAIAHDDFYGKLIASYAARHHVKPGLTGWAQVNGYRGETPRVEDMEARVAHDLWYIDNWSIWLDLRIMVRTALMLASDKKAY